MYFRNRSLDPYNCLDFTRPKSANSNLKIHFLPNSDMAPPIVNALTIMIGANAVIQLAVKAQKKFHRNHVAAYQQCVEMWTDNLFAFRYKPALISRIKNSKYLCARFYFLRGNFSVVRQSFAVIRKGDFPKFFFPCFQGSKR